MIQNPLLKRLIKRAYSAGHGQLHEQSTQAVHEHLAKLVPPQTKTYLSKDYHPKEHIRFRIYRHEKPQGTMLFIRASAFTGGGLMDECDAMCSMLKEKFAMDVVNLDFRTPPQYRFPIYFEDIVNTTLWIKDHIDELNLKQPFYGWGESSGGTMLASLCQYLAKHNISLFKAQVLLYPMLDLVTDFPSKKYYQTGYMLELPMIHWLEKRILNDLKERTDYRASPGLYKPQNQPATILLTCEHDPLRDEGEAYAKALASQGNQVLHKTMPDMIHGFVRYYTRLTEAQEGLDWIKKSLQSIC